MNQGSTLRLLALGLALAGCGGSSLLQRYGEAIGAHQVDRDTCALLTEDLREELEAEARLHPEPAPKALAKVIGVLHAPQRPTRFPSGAPPELELDGAQRARLSRALNCSVAREVSAGRSPRNLVIAAYFADLRLDLESHPGHGLQPDGDPLLALALIATAPTESTPTQLAPLTCAARQALAGQDEQARRAHLGRAFAQLEARGADFAPGDLVFVCEGGTTPPAPIAVRPQDGCYAQVPHAARVHGLDPGLIKAVIHVESRGQSRALSNKGARGCMQLMKRTAKAMGVKDRNDPEQNVLGGARYLKRMLKRFDGSVVRALGAYNAGPGRIRKRGKAWAAVPNKGYVCKVLSAWDAPPAKIRRLHGAGCVGRVAGGKLLERLHPALRRKARELATRSAARGIELYFISGYRRPRGKPSWHHFGLAFDLNLKGRKTMKTALKHFDEDKARWEAVGAIARDLGLTWGLPWGRKEVFHFEWHPGQPAAFTAKVKRGLVKRAGSSEPEAVWRLFEPQS